MTTEAELKQMNKKDLLTAALDLLSAAEKGEAGGDAVLEALTTKNKNLTIQIEAIVEQQGARDDQIKVLQTTLGAKNEAIAALEGQVDPLHREVAGLNDQLHESTEKVAALLTSKGTGYHSINIGVGESCAEIISVDLPTFALIVNEGDAVRDAVGPDFDTIASLTRKWGSLEVVKV